MSRITEYEKWKLNGELEDKLLLVEGWARDGLTEKQIADNLGISQDRLIDYKKKYLEFFEAIKKGKEIVDYEVENALLKRALGYTITIKEDKLDKDGCVHSLERDVHVPADTTAQIFWLKNRQKEKWRDKQDITNDEELNKLDKILEEQKNAYMDN
jgi:hypothetical protein